MVKEALEKQYVELLGKWKGCIDKLRENIKKYHNSIKKTEAELENPFIKIISRIDKDEKSFLNVLNKAYNLCDTLMANSKKFVRYEFLQKICETYFSYQNIRFPEQKNLFVQAENEEREYRRRINMLYELIDLTQQQINEFKAKRIAEEHDFAFIVN